MVNKLSECNIFKTEWTNRLAPYGYQTCEQFLSVCRLDEGAENLSSTMGCTLETVREIEEKMISVLGPAASLPPYDAPPSGVVLEENESDSEVS